MDITDKFAIISGLLLILSIIVEQGTECAAAVWHRTAEELDDIDFLEGNTVPMTTGVEALLITVSALIKMIAFCPLKVATAIYRKSWRISPEARLARIRLTLRSDVLLAVFSMISGYPERAGLLYLDTLRERIADDDTTTTVPATLVT